MVFMSWYYNPDYFHFSYSGLIYYQWIFLEIKNVRQTLLYTFRTLMIPYFITCAVIIAIMAVRIFLQGPVLQSLFMSCCYGYGQPFTAPVWITLHLHISAWLVHCVFFRHYFLPLILHICACAPGMPSSALCWLHLPVLLPAGFSGFLIVSRLLWQEPFSYSAALCSAKEYPCQIKRSTFYSGCLFYSFCGIHRQRRRQVIHGK